MARAMLSDYSLTLGRRVYGALFLGTPHTSSNAAAVSMAVQNIVDRFHRPPSPMPSKEEIRLYVESVLLANKLFDSDNERWIREKRGVYLATIQEDQEADVRGIRRAKVRSQIAVHFPPCL